MVPQTEAELDEEQQEKLEKLIDMLEDDDDVRTSTITKKAFPKM